MKLTRWQEDVLAALKRKGDWCRPLDIGAYDGSYHSAVLSQLVKKGLAHRRRRGYRWSYEYVAGEVSANQEESR